MPPLGRCRRHRPSASSARSSMKPWPVRSAAMTDADYRGGIYDGAYQGAPGAFSEDASRTLLGSAATLLPCNSLEDVFRAVADGRASCGVVPTSNSIAGAVPDVDALLQRHAVRMRGEISVRISEALVGLGGA